MKSSLILLPASLLQADAKPAHDEQGTVFGGLAVETHNKSPGPGMDQTEARGAAGCEQQAQGCNALELPGLPDPRAKSKRPATFVVGPFDLAGGLGFEPRLTESESVVLPLDDPPKEPLRGFLQAAP